MQTRRPLATLVVLAVSAAWLVPSAAALTLPVQDSSLRLWLDGSDIDLFGNTTLTSGGFVTTWQDKSTYNNDAIASAAAPTYSAAGLNGSPAVHFVGANSNYFSVADATGLDGGPISIFMVYNLSTANGGIMSKGRDGYGAWAIRRENGLFSYRFVSPTTDYRVNGPQWTLNQSQVTFNTYNGAALESYQGGLLRGSVSTPAGTPGNNTQSMRIGGYIDGAAGYITGDIAEVVIYDRALSAAEQRSVGYYLTEKYGLASAYYRPGLVVTDNFTTGNQQAYAGLVSATDLINQGRPTLASTSVSGYAPFSNFGPYTKMNDGILGGNTDGDNANAVADSDGDFTITYFLNTTNVKGYDITQIRSFTAHQDNRVSQAFTVEYTTADDPTWTRLGYFASAAHTGGANQAAMLTITDESGVIASAVTALRFHVTNPPPNGNWSVWREFDVQGVAVPEPSTFLLAALGLVGLALARRRARP